MLYTVTKVWFGEFQVCIGAAGIVEAKVRRAILQTLCDGSVIFSSTVFLSLSLLQDLMHTNFSA